MKTTKLFSYPLPQSLHLASTLLSFLFYSCLDSVFSGHSSAEFLVIAKKNRLRIGEIRYEPPPPPLEVGNNQKTRHQINMTE